MFRLDADGWEGYLHREAIDFRIGINGLAILVEQAMHLDPFGRAVVSPCNIGAATGSGFLFYERSGFWLMMKARRPIVLRGRVGQQQAVVEAYRPNSFTGYSKASTSRRYGGTRRGSIWSVG